MSEIYITIFDYSNEACAFRWLLIKDESTINASIDIEFAFFCYDEQNLNNHMHCLQTKM